MVFAHQDLVKISSGKSPMFFSKNGIGKDQIQMASVDTTLLGGTVYEMVSSGLPMHCEPVTAIINDNCREKILFGSGGVILKKGVCYIVPLAESFSLSKNLRAIFSPKSSIGRIDLFVRVLTDGYSRYDGTIRGYEGRLYLSIIPMSFDVLIKPGEKLTQFRIVGHDTCLTDEEISLAHSEYGLLYGVNGVSLSNSNLKVYDNSLVLHIDLSREVIGFKSRDDCTNVLDLSKIGYHDRTDFWEPIIRPDDFSIVLKPGPLYLLSTLERVNIPSRYCAEVVAFDPSMTESRIHYAGFFDPGFGITPAVLEVRANGGVGERLNHAQNICRMTLSRISQVPDKLYGKHSGSNYSSSNPSLSKHFRNKEW